MVPKLKTGAKEKIDRLLHEVVSKRQVPAVVYGATNVEGPIYLNQDGDVYFDDPSRGKIDEDTTMALYSMTKFITSIAALQLVDSGLLSLDNPDTIAKYLPDLVSLPLIEGYNANDTPILTKPKNKITLRMLLSHSAGTGYTHRERILDKWIEQKPRIPLFEPGASIESLLTPLIYEPGTTWRYGNALDWVGVLVERASGLDLENYFAQYIFQPCNVTSMTFYPTKQVQEHQMPMSIRDAEGKIQVPRDGGIGFRRPKTPAEVTFLSGGAGLYGTQKDYLAILRGILRSDPRNRGCLRDNEKASLSEQMFMEMFKPSLPSGEGYDGSRRLADFVAEANYAHPIPTEDTVNHSVACMINLEKWTDRRQAGSGCWSGTGRTQWWIDPTTGVAGICATQLRCGTPDPWYQVYVDYEKALYNSIE
ncbi:uncharacterized protein I303_106920 [Kwoniella dejecticola CBS 10117]|uniref:Beta-lactamase-related domain-containing protein n=1 Tax=Kwoniella dejecticola CBS 10117 TaxID=1296121 RepID=A0AAJ8KVN7_9TREE